MWQLHQDIFVPPWLDEGMTDDVISTILMASPLSPEQAQTCIDSVHLVQDQ